MATPLYDSETALRPRHLVSWMLFAGAAGTVNATAFLACATFVTHVTGTITRIGLDSGTWQLMLEYTLVLGCFVAGAFAATAFLRKTERPSAFALALFGTASLLLVVAALGTLGVFGPFGGSVEEPGDFALLSLLGFAMGVQNATVASATALGLRTTHMTGPASDIGAHLGTALTSSGPARAAALRLSAVRGAKLAAFVVGAALAVPLARSFEFGAFIVPAAMITLATLTSLVNSKENVHEISSGHGRAGARSAA
jgi:uncharacterized membrane protein YoaK (UPF0700 family)